MECKNDHKRVLEFKYEFDRLGKQKMEQVYNILLSKVMQDYEKELVLSLLKGRKQLVQRGKKQ